MTWRYFLLDANNIKGHDPVMKILFICRFLPHPKARDSGRQDQYHYIESLSQQHQVSLIAFTQTEENSAIETMEAICEQVVGLPYKEHSPFSRLWRLGWRILLPKVYGRVFSLSYRSALQHLLKQLSQATSRRTLPLISMPPA